MANGGGFIIVVVEAVNNRMIPVLSSSEPVRRYYKLYIFRKNTFRYRVQNVFVTKCCLCPS